MTGRQKPFECWIVFLSVLLLLVACSRYLHRKQRPEYLSFGFTPPLQKKVCFKKKQKPKTKIKKAPGNKTPSVLWNRSGENLRALGVHSAAAEYSELVSLPVYLALW